MKNKIMYAVLSIALLCSIASNFATKQNDNLVCFDAGKVKQYNTQGYKGYIFNLVGQSGKFVVEVDNPQHKAGVIVCKGNFDFSNNLNVLFQNLGC